MDDDESRANDPSRVRQSREVEKEYPPDTPDLNRDMVMLDIPSTLYGLSADISLRASEVIGRLIQNSARRYASAVQYLKPLLGKALSIKGLYPPEATTLAPNSSTTTETSVKEARSAKLTPATKKSTASTTAASTSSSTTTVTTAMPRVIRVTRAAAILPEGTTDDTPDFNRDQVMLDIPDQLFGNSFTIVTSVSKIFGDFMMNSARRYAAFMQYFKPLLGKALTIKGIYPPPPTTTAAPSIAEASSSTTESNAV